MSDENEYWFQIRQDGQTWNLRVGDTFNILNGTHEGKWLLAHIDPKERVATVRGLENNIGKMFTVGEGEVHKFNGPVV